MKKLTKEQAIIVTGFTGKLIGKFSDFHKDIEKRLKIPIMLDEMAHLDSAAIYKDDFIKMNPSKDALKGQDEVQQ